MEFLANSDDPITDFYLGGSLMTQNIVDEFQRNGPKLHVLVSKHSQIHFINLQIGTASVRTNKTGK